MTPTLCVKKKNIMFLNSNIINSAFWEKMVLFLVTFCNLLKFMLAPKYMWMRILLSYSIVRMTFKAQDSNFKFPTIFDLGIRIRCLSEWWLCLASVCFVLVHFGHVPFGNRFNFLRVSHLEFAPLYSRIVTVTRQDAAFLLATQSRRFAPNIN